MSVMDEPIEDGVGYRGISDAVMPVFHGQLAGDNRGRQALSVFNDFQQITALMVGQRGQAEVVYNEDFCFGQLVHELAIRAVGFGQSQVVEQPWGSYVERRMSVAARPIGQGAGQVG
jgi:hypothetical protein